MPNTGWLDGCVALDAKGFIKTGPDLSQDDLGRAQWPLARAPYLLETSLPVSSPSATCAAATSNAWRRPSAKDRLRSRSFIRVLQE